MQARQKLITVEEFLEIPDPPDGTYELVRGELVTVTPPGWQHGRFVIRLGTALEGFSQAHELGMVMAESGYVLERDPDTVRGPDVSFVSTERLPPGALPKSPYIERGPTLAIEVKSPHDRERNIQEKVAEYLAAGADRVWVVRPERRTVTVQRRDCGPVTRTVGETLDSDDAGFAREGFALPLSDLFG